MLAAGHVRWLKEHCPQAAPCERGAQTCDLLLVPEQALNEADLDGFRFRRLLVCDEHPLPASALEEATADDSALVLDVSTAAAYRNRLAPLFLHLLRSQGICPPGCASHRLDLALHEAITNAIVHGSLELRAEHDDLESMTSFYRQMTERIADPARGGRRIRIAAGIEEDQLLVAISDQGPGHRLRGVPPVSADATHGRGLRIMADYARRIEFANGGRTCRLWFPCPQAPCEGSR